MTYGKISRKQQEILDYIKNEILTKGYPPAVREICEAVQLKSTSSVHAHLASLERNGYNFNAARSEMVSVPIVGRVAAGEPILAEENIESYFPIPAERMPRSDAFILEVHGESMINAGILDGDYVLVQSQNTAENGNMVVALLDDSATVKTFYKEDGHFRLQPENDTMEPIIVGDELKILGNVRLQKKACKVSAHYRSFSLQSLEGYDIL